jgi:hypothetical protein
LSIFYITINLADVYNPLVKFLAGHDINIDKLLPEQSPNYLQQSILIAQNPFIAARFFNIYYGCVEAQGRGMLHCHMIIWLKAGLNCDQIHSKILVNDKEFQTRMINYINDCISN